MRYTPRLPALFALALPVLAGCAWMAFGGAPPHYALANAGVLLAALGWILFARIKLNRKQQRIAIAVLLALLFLPLATGPESNGIARWLPLGPVALHVGMLVVPALAVLATREPDYAAPILLTGILAAFFQPDAATGFALVFAAVGMHDITRRWHIGLVVILGFFASLIMAIRGELPAQPFVERVIVDAAMVQPAAALALLAALVGGFFLILFAAPLPRSERFALAGSLFGFGMMAIVSHYPTPLIGYGAAPILGYAVALALAPDPAKPAADA